MNAKHERFPLFDSLRAIAALSVLAFHASFTPGALGDTSSLVPYFKRLDVGVSVFFLISGFLLYRPFVRAHLAGEDGPKVQPYAWRRFLRIVPGYWVALTIITIWIGLGGVFTGGGIVTYYGFGQGLRSETFAGGLVQAWTLGVEVAFYIFLPIYAFVLHRMLRSRPHLRLRGEVVGLVALAAVGVAWNVIVLLSLGPIARSHAPWLFAFPAFLHQFALGMALAVASVALSERTRRPAAVRMVERFPGVAWLAAAGVFVALAVGIGLEDGVPQDRDWLLRSLLSGVLGFFLLLPAVFGDGRRGAVRRLLGSRVMLYLGTVSYGIYLWHVAVVTQLEGWGLGSLGGNPISMLVWAVLVAAVTTLIATLSWRLVEKPVLRLKNRAFGRRTAAPAHEPALATAGPDSS